MDLKHLRFSINPVTAFLLFPLLRLLALRGDMEILRNKLSIFMHVRHASPRGKLLRAASSDESGQHPCMTHPWSALRTAQGAPARSLLCYYKGFTERLGDFLRPHTILPADGSRDARRWSCRSVKTACCPLRDRKMWPFVSKVIFTHNALTSSGRRNSTQSAQPLTLTETYRSEDPDEFEGWCKGKSNTKSLRLERASLMSLALEPLRG